MLRKMRKMLTVAVVAATLSAPATGAQAAGSNTAVSDVVRPAIVRITVSWQLYLFTSSGTNVNVAFNGGKPYQATTRCTG